MGILTYCIFLSMKMILLGRVFNKLIYSLLLSVVTLNESSRNFISSWSISSKSIPWGVVCNGFNSLYLIMKTLRTHGFSYIWWQLLRYTKRISLQTLGFLRYGLSRLCRCLQGGKWRRWPRRRCLKLFEADLLAIKTILRMKLKSKR